MGQAANHLTFSRKSLSWDDGPLSPAGEEEGDSASAGANPRGHGRCSGI